MALLANAGTAFGVKALVKKALVKRAYPSLPIVYAGAMDRNTSLLRVLVQLQLHAVHKSLS